MAAEIERKFLVASQDWKKAVTGQFSLKQAYLSYDPERTVRVRTKGDEAFLTIKGITTSLTRPEYEYAIPHADALELLALCEHPAIEKVRHHVPVGDHLWEVDVFEGANAGLILAEVELSSEDEHFERPTWLGPVVSGDRRYSNSTLSLQPYSTWHD